MGSGPVLRAVLAVLLVGAGVAGCDRAEPEVPAGELRIATGGTGGVYYRYGNAISNVVSERVPQLRPTVLSTNASEANMQKIVAGEAEVGFAQADIAARYVSEGAPVRALARLYDDYLHLVVPRDSPVRSLSDLKGRRVSIGNPGSGTLVTVSRLLAVAGLNPDTDFAVQRIGPDDSAAALRAGAVDAFFYSVGLPADTVTLLAATYPIRLVDLGQYAAPLRARYDQFYLRHTVPASTYDQDLAVTTIGMPNYLMVSEKMPDVTAYAITGALFDGRATLDDAHPVAARLNVREAINTYPVPLHPGAVRWFRENKR